MERAGLKTLQSVASPLHFRARSSLFPPFLLPKVVVHNLHPPHLYSSSRLSTLHSLCIRSDAKPLPNGAECGDAAAQHKLLQVVLVSPQIPGNTGSIARTCAASAVGLHLVEPLGFPIDNTKLKRAGLDYWPYVVVKVHQSWDEFREYFRGQAGEKRLLAFTKRGTTTHSDFSYKKGDWLVFGSETKGLPPEALLDCQSESLGGGTLRIPMVETYVRCLNLSVSVGIAVYEASRQINYEQLQCPPETCMDTETSFVTEDIFA
ncbi:putative tRNA (cytidine(34)-2'-O)-methyltransferase isoform X2 [Capsicum annuum]|uniref:putative tRNA (cytidine(34)-2'-O)-methyltransferase isoform X2 n=1 Tax=Capsicum annuum TaxID=4072 RepID=UPI0007BF253E|nr:putative tRNA (cytidine(34)-2'-O)-methyltransferase isoform X2 [Capsicum annuum]